MTETLSQFGHDVGKVRLVNSVTAGFNAITRQPGA